LFGAAPRVLPGLAGPFTGAILIGPGARPQTHCEEDNHRISHGGELCKLSARQRFGPGSCAKKSSCAKKKPAGWNYTGGQGDSGRVTSEMKKFWNSVARIY